MSRMSWDRSPPGAQCLAHTFFDPCPKLSPLRRLDYEYEVGPRKFLLGASCRIFFWFYLTLSESGGARRCIACAPCHAARAPHAGASITTHPDSGGGVRCRHHRLTTHTWAVLAIARGAATVGLSPLLIGTPGASIAVAMMAVATPSPLSSSVVVTAAAASAPAPAPAAADGRLREIDGGSRVDRSRNLICSSTDKPVAAPSIPENIWRSRACSCSGINSASNTRAFGGAAIHARARGALSRTKSRKRTICSQLQYTA